ncbi:MAG: biopolymer transporter ExbD [Myxococcota bacterium]|nr:biopolymer transporter ExbD [Myxococcota bacterium]
MLTSLMDMFTIILIFLIVSFNAEDYNFRLDPDLTLPESSARSVFKPAVNLVINPEAILVEGERVLPLYKGKATKAQLESGELPELIEALKPFYERAQFLASGLEEVTDENDPALIVVQADKELRYETLFLVLRSASIAGFVRYRLAIMKR